MLGGTILVTEGRGYRDDGSTAFNAFAVISYDPGERAYSMRSYAQGKSGDFAIVPSANGYVWEIPAGPATIRYEAVIADGKWTETGDYVMPGQPPRRFFEMHLTRIGDSDWPAGEPVSRD